MGLSRVNDEASISHCFLTLLPPEVFQRTTCALRSTTSILLQRVVETTRRISGSHAGGAIEARVHFVCFTMLRRFPACMCIRRLDL